MLWKLWDHHSEDEFDQRMLQQAIEDKKHLLILESKEWKIPIHLYSFVITASTKTKIDMLKKMVMNSFLQMEVSDVDQISSTLQVDPVFIQDIVRQMMVTGVVEIRSGVYRLTETGKEQYEAGTILSQPETETTTFDYSPYHQEVIQLDQNFLVKEDWDLEFYRYYEDTHSLVDTVFDEEAVRQVIKESGQVFEIGGSEKIITNIEPVIIRNISHAKCYEFQLYDLLEDKVYSRVWNGASSRWDERLEEELNQREGDVWKEKYKEAIIQQFPERYEEIRRQIKEFDVKGKKKGKAVQILRGKDIRDQFLNAFTTTKRKMLMVSPWISSQVVDRDMLKRFENFAKQGKTLYISWGIAKSIEKEDRRPSEELLEKISQVQHKDGTQAIFVRWFGNQHNKEIVIDSDKLLLGSFNWLSYRGDYDIRYESVVVMEEGKVIKDTIHFIEDKFITALETELTILLNNGSINEIQVKNWMMELLLLDSLEEKRRKLSNQLINYLYDQEQEELIYELATMWVRYDKEEFGVRKYLGYLLSQDKKDVAKTYYELCRKHIHTVRMWPNTTELKEYKDWFDEQHTSKRSQEKSKKK